MQNVVDIFSITDCDAYEYEKFRKEINTNFEKINNVLKNVDNQKKEDEKKE